MYIPLAKQPKKQIKKNTKRIKEFIFKAVKAYIVKEFEYYMNELDKVNERIRMYLHNIGYHKWVRDFLINNKYSIITLNIVESMNVVSATVMELPIIIFLEYLRSLIDN